MKVESRGALQDLISEKAAHDAAYREALLRDPRGLLAKHLGHELPPWLNVKVVEEQADTVYLISPHVPGEDLEDGDLAMLAGGKGGGGMTVRDVHCERNYGAFNSVLNLEANVGL